MTPLVALVNLKIVLQEEVQLCAKLAESGLNGPKGGPRSLRGESQPSWRPEAS
jgi:hypothetical protein